MTRKAIEHVDCGKLISSLEAILTRWKGKTLSYSGRIRLLQWVFHEKLTYILQSYLLSSRMLNGQKEVKWANTVFLKSERAYGY